VPFKPSSPSSTQAPSANVAASAKAMLRFFIQMNLCRMATLYLLNSAKKLTCNLNDNDYHS
jgi:hypothetical protein